MINLISVANILKKNVGGIYLKHINPDGSLGLKGHGDYPTRARCLPLMGRIAVLCLSDTFMHTIFMFSDFSQRIKKYEFSFSK